MSYVPTSSPTMPAGSRFGRHFIIGAALGGLVIAAGATALWARDDGGSSSTLPSVENGAPAPAVIPEPRNSVTESTMFAVNSEAEAAEMQGVVADANAIRSALGEPPLTIVVSGQGAIEPSKIGRRANEAEGYDFGIATTPVTTAPVVTSSLALGEDASAVANLDRGTTSDVLTVPDVTVGTDGLMLGEDATALANFSTAGSTTDDSSLSLGEDEGAVAGFHGK